MLLVDDDEIWSRFQKLVNMSPTELERWLKSEESRTAASSEGRQNSYIREGRRTVRMMRKGRIGLSPADLRHAGQLADDVEQRLKADGNGQENLERILWRRQLMNRGHDPDR